MKIADVFVNLPVKSIAKAYSYSIPEAYSFVGTGWRVFVPFGNRKLEGFIVNVHQQEDAAIRQLKPILDTVDQEAWFTEKMMQSARWLADFYLCSLAESMRLFMPGKSGLKIKTVYRCLGKEDEAEFSQAAILLQAEPYAQIYHFIEEKGLSEIKEIRHFFGNENYSLDTILAQMQKYRLITKDFTASGNASPVYEKVFYPQEPPEVLSETEIFHRRPAQKKAWLLLKEKGALKSADLKKYKISSAVMQALQQAGVARVEEKRVLRDSYRETAGASVAFELSDMQKNAVVAIACQQEKQSTGFFLLHGVTGSGKTQVYIEAARKARKDRRQVVVLVPEIALTGQLVQAFKAYFSHDIIVIHSRLSVSERNDAVLRLRQNEIGIVIGARSALFMPFDDLGLLILDEEHDPSYKQDESPRYHARDVAKAMAEIHQAVLILGSATPSVESYAHAQKGNYQLLSMPERIGTVSLPQVSFVDMRQELKRGNRKVISRQLQQLIETTISRHEQVIIMLNRRGYSTFVMCRSCGEVIRCKICGMPLVYHKNGRLQCHHCDVTELAPDICPKCESRYIKYFGTGTERLEQELQDMVPGARIIRMDRDTTSRKFAHQEILSKFKNREYDILLGTQMVAKGHDIPNVTAVGIISADASLHMPDFRAAERCFMLITQTAGRAGRGDSPGKVIVQTYNPGHYAVQTGLAQDYAGFYRTEIALRRELFYPPFSQLIKITVQHAEEAKALKMARELSAQFKSHFGKIPGMQCIGPAPAMIAKFREIYRFNLLLKTQDIDRVRAFLRENNLHLRKEILLDINPLNTL